MVNSSSKKLLPASTCAVTNSALPATWLTIPTGPTTGSLLVPTTLATSTRTSAGTRTALGAAPTISASDRGPLKIPRSGNPTTSLAGLSQLACLLVNTPSHEGPKETVGTASVHLAAIQLATTLGQSAMLTSGGPLTPSGDAETEMTQQSHPTTYLIGNLDAL